MTTKNTYRVMAVQTRVDESDVRKVVAQPYDGYIFDTLEGAEEALEMCLDHVERAERDMLNRDITGPGIYDSLEVYDANGPVA